MEEISRPMKTMQQLDRAGHEHHADGAEEDEGVVLAGVGGVAFEVVERAEQRGDDDGGDEQVEEDAEGVDLDVAAEGGVWAVMKLIVAGEHRRRRSEDGEPAEGLAAGAGLEHRLDEHDEDAGDGEDVLGRERQ